MSSLLELKNGSDIRGIALPTEKHSAKLTTEAITAIGWGLIHWFRTQKSGPLVVGIGRDSRISGPALATSLKKVFATQNITVLDFGLATTPAMFMATQFPEFACDFALMLTASHLPYYYNGVKVFSQKGGAEKQDIEAILTNTTPLATVAGGTIRKADLLPTYSKFLVDKIRENVAADVLDPQKPLKGLQILVDAGNGAGGFFAQQVLQPLGADTTGSQFLEPDGHFPNHIPNPDNQEAITSIRNAVLNHEADLGIIFDTDVDRSGVITKSGKILNRNNLIAVLSRILLTESPNAVIVTNSPTSDHLKAFIEALGGRQVRYLSGYRNVINKAIALNEQGIDCPLAIETSGHAAFRENYFLDDGAYVIAKILSLLPTLQETGQTLDDLIADLKQPAEVLEVRLPLQTAEPRLLGEQIIEDFFAYVDTVPSWQVNLENEEGIRISMKSSDGSGWFLLRMSLHEPLLVLQIENDEIGHLPTICKKLVHFFRNYPQVELTPLKASAN